MKINKNIVSKMRVDKGLNIKELSAKAGITTITMYRALQRGQNIQLKTLQKIAKALNCKPSSIILEEE